MSITIDIIHLETIKPYLDESKYKIDYKQSFEGAQDNSRMTVLYFDLGKQTSQEGEAPNYTTNPLLRKAIFYVINREKLLSDFNKKAPSEETNTKKTVFYHKPIVTFLPDNIKIPSYMYSVYNDTTQHKTNYFEFIKDGYLQEAQDLWQQFKESTSLQTPLKLTLYYPTQDKAIDYQLLATLIKAQIEGVFVNEINIDIKELPNLTSNPMMGSLGNPQEKAEYNNCFKIDDLKYTPSNKPFFISLDKTQSIQLELSDSQKTYLTQAHINADFSKPIKISDLESGQGTTKNIIPNLIKQPFSQDKEECLLTILQQLEKKCYQEMRNIPLLRKINQITVVRK
ncbi:hypothetical protein [Candidatus Phytoplasma meliae]|uniref:Uncharacterized protein n=1 Tax=Candidatus Phytoplasma meliae TaxID=1848402 RepID=A0ABS5CZ76_9MOLU|nr:hypothetical protein [Candidatus Phytoplasma meliae]MBP5836278.1 hypothetical protein [Candidatus Phytoplasma meliae]